MTGPAQVIGTLINSDGVPVLFNVEGVLQDRTGGGREFVFPIRGPNDLEDFKDRRATLVVYEPEDIGDEIEMSLRQVVYDGNSGYCSVWDTRST